MSCLDSPTMGNYPTSTEDATSGQMPGVWKIDKPITGYKQIHCHCQNDANRYHYKFIARLTIPQGAKVVRSKEKYEVSDKIRTNKFKIEEIEAMPKNPDNYAKCIPSHCYSDQSSGFKYQPGKTYHPDKLDEDINKECTNGLYFFLQKIQAYNYNTLSLRPMDIGPGDGSD